MNDKYGVDLNNFKKLVDLHTREEIAKALNCDTSLVTKHYNGDRNITLDFAIKYSRFFGVSLDYLVGNTEIQTTDTNIRAICDYTGLSEKSINALNAQTKIEENDITYFHDDDYRNVSTEFIDYFISSNAIFEIALSIDRCNDTYRKSNEALTDTVEDDDIDAFPHGQDFETSARAFRYEAVEKFTDAINKFINETKCKNSALMKKAEAIYIKRINEFINECKDSGD